ncbi:hypothetical protein K431DRAFT_202257, partial [Polychaeton citri CBS 116435]
MKKPFAARRVPRKIGGDREEEEPNSSPDVSGAETTAVFRPKTNLRKSSKLRKSFGPSIATDDDDDEDVTASGVVTPKRANLNRIAVHRNAQQKRPSALVQSLPRLGRGLDSDGEGTGDDGGGGPSYSVAELQRLKESTPTTPRDLASADATDVEAGLSLTAKFGTNLSRYDPSIGQSSAIPSETEIAEKKARRARLAQEEKAEEYISLDPDDPDLGDGNVMQDDFGHLILKPKDKWGTSESRLVAEDEDMLENFDEFTNESGRVPLGEKARQEAERRRRNEMKLQISAAEGAASDGDDDSADDSERERNAAFEDAQTRHGTYSSNTTSAIEKERQARPRTPPNITPLPTLDGVLDRLRNQVAELQSSRMQRLKEMEALQREKIRIGEEEIRIQKALRETAEKFEALRRERGIQKPAAI